MANNNWVMVKRVVPPLVIGTVVIVGYALLVRIFALKEK
ncbi:hypothetical protein ES703_15533 [subsurface metagenome]